MKISFSKQFSGEKHLLEHILILSCKPIIYRYHSYYFERTFQWGSYVVTIKSKNLFLKRLKICSGSDFPVWHFLVLGTWRLRQLFTNLRTKSTREKIQNQKTFSSDRFCLLGAIYLVSLRKKNLFKDCNEDRSIFVRFLQINLKNPVDTRRRIDVEKTSCVYWEITELIVHI